MKKLIQLIVACSHVFFLPAREAGKSPELNEDRPGGNPGILRKAAYLPALSSTSIPNETKDVWQNEIEDTLRAGRQKDRGAGVWPGNTGFHFVQLEDQSAIDGEAMESSMDSPPSDRLNLEIVDINDSQITFEIAEGIDKGWAELFYGPDIESLQGEALPLMTVVGPFGDKHQISIPLPYKTIPTGSRDGFFMIHHRIASGVDIDGPAITILTPADGLGVKSPSLLIKGTVTDRGRGGNGVKAVFVNGIRADFSNNESVSGMYGKSHGILNWQYQMLLHSGFNKIVIHAEDYLYNRSEIVLNIENDASAGSSPVPTQDYIIGSLGSKMIWVDPGTFLMGSPPTETQRDSDETQHTVTLTQGYWLGEAEVTQEEWVAMMGKNPSYYSGAGFLPVEQVSWLDCLDFCRRLTDVERAAGRISNSMKYTLPTEAQWEMACRAGGQSANRFHTG